MFIDVAEQLGYAHEKLSLVLNRADSNHGIRVEDVERSVGRKVDHMVVSDGRAAVHALNTGVPFVLGNRRARVSEDVVALAQALFAEHEEAPLPGQAPRRGSSAGWRSHGGSRFKRGRSAGCRC